MKRLAIILLILIASGTVAWVVARSDNATASGYEYTEITRGDIENTISASGTLKAVGTVEVGTQVSGTISEVMVDYNEDVEKGQVLAVVDRTMLDASVRDAEAGVLRAQAEYDRSASDHRRLEELYEQELISEADLEDSSTSLQVAEAAVISAEAALERAEANLGYAVITSPIDGTVIMRSIEPGQTVAASYSTPTLFVIAEDLSRMEIHALVDESDIGQIKEGQTVRFTVAAYMDEEFEGVVRQVWLQPETVQNVVNYTVVVDAENEGGLLLPGMTATTDFLIEERNDVLLVSNAALRVQPSAEMLEALRSQMEERLAEMPEEKRTAIEERMAPGSESSASSGTGASGVAAGSESAAGEFPGSLRTMRSGGASGSEDRAVLWYLGEDGEIHATRVKKGVTDGRNTEVDEGEGEVLIPGMAVISSVPDVDEDTASPSKNPLAAGMGGPPRGGR